MNIYCFSCHCLHKFTNGEAERVVYSLLAAVSDATISREESGIPEDHVPCLKDVWDDSHDPEGYLEWTDALKENRIKHERNSP